MGENFSWNRISLRPLCALFTDFGDVFRNDSLGWSILVIAVPAALALAADPVASLIDTAFIGQLGAVNLAAVGVAIAVINQASKIAIFPLVSVTTSLVAEEEASDDINNSLLQEAMIEFGSSESEETDELLGQAKKLNINNPGNQRRHFPSATSALVVASVLGLIQALFLVFCAKIILNYMGISSNSPMLVPAQRYLVLRSIGSPAVLLSLAMQGVFRGIQDTKTPLYATLVGDVANVALDPIFIFGFQFGVSGAATAHVISQYIIVIILLWRLNEHVDLLPPSIWDLQFKRFLGNGFLLLMRVIAATFCVTMATSLAARHGSTSMAAFQICLQIWLASSLLADGLAVAGQAMLASAFTRKDFRQAGAVASRVLQLAILLGLGLCGILLIGLPVVCQLFTKDASVLELVAVGIPFVAATQPVNVLAFVFDGVNYGASDFAYSAYSMMLVALVSLICLILLSSTYGYVGIWISLTIFMSLRAVAGLYRIVSGTGPWNFLRS